MSSNLITVGALGFVFLLLNGIFLGVIFFTQRRVNQVSKWNSTLGTVTMSTIEQRHSTEGGYVDYPAILYSYQVSGQPYEGFKIAPGPQVGGSGARKVVARYPEGAQVMVFYDPQNPAEAVLEKKAPAQWVMWLILAIFDCVLCVVVPITIWSFGR